MSSYTRSAKRQKVAVEKVPRCCGAHMFMNKYGLYQCKKCGRQRFPIGNAVTVDDNFKTEEVQAENVGIVEPETTTVIDVDPITNINDIVQAKEE